MRPHALRGLSSSDTTGEVQAHGGAAAGRRGTPRGRGRRPTFSESRPRQQVGLCRCSRPAWPRMNSPPCGWGPLRPRGETARPAHRASCRASAGRSRAASAGSRPSFPSSAKYVATKYWVNSATSTGRPTACPMFIFSSTGRGANRPAQPHAGGRGSSRRCPGTRRIHRRRSSGGWAAARPRSAAGRTGCPRARAARARGRWRTSRSRRGSDSVTPAGFWKVGTV